MVGHMTHKSHVKSISFNATMLNGSLGEEEGGGKTALIDQRAVAAGKNSFSRLKIYTFCDTLDSSPIFREIQCEPLTLDGVDEGGAGEDVLVLAGEEAEVEVHVVLSRGLAHTDGPGAGSQDQ